MTYQAVLLVPEIKIKIIIITIIIIIIIIIITITYLRLIYFEVTAQVKPCSALYSVITYHRSEIKD
jgi:hypothetical protein